MVIIPLWGAIFSGGFIGKDPLQQLEGGGGAGGYMPTNYRPIIAYSIGVGGGIRSMPP